MLMRVFLPRSGTVIRLLFLSFFLSHLGIRAHTVHMLVSWVLSIAQAVLTVTLFAARMQGHLLQFGSMCHCRKG